MLKKELMDITNITDITMLKKELIDITNVTTVLKKELIDIIKKIEKC